jgi:hypothetical protein
LSVAEIPSQQDLQQMAALWLPPRQLPPRFRIHTDTSDYFRVEYDDIVFLDGRSYLIRHNAKEQRFGLEEEVKFWVKWAIDLTDGSRKIIKLVFHERFIARIGTIEFECFRSPRKEARILALAADHPNFMHGLAIQDDKGNFIRVIDFIAGPTLAEHVAHIDGDHEAYFYRHFPESLDNFIECIEAIRFLHDRGEKHGDIRRDHILVEENSGRYRWIDFDYNYRHRESMYAYDLFGLGNVLAYLVGKQDVLLADLAKDNHSALASLTADDVNIVFKNRVVNLRKVYPYIPEQLNRVLLHFSQGAKRFYEHTTELLEDLREVKLLLLQT